MRGTSGHVSDIAEANTLLHGEENVEFGDAGYQGVEKRADATKEVTWHVAMRPGKRRALNKENQADALIDKAEKLKAGIRAKLEHPFRVIKRQFGFVKVRYRGLKKNTAQLVTLFALSNPWMARGKLMGETEHECAQKPGQRPAGRSKRQKKRSDFKSFLVKFHDLKTNDSLRQWVVNCSDLPQHLFNLIQFHSLSGPPRAYCCFVRLQNDGKRLETLWQ